MGLAGPKKNTKISADPRNTHWASNTDRFGHRILEQYGWTPGSALGDTTSAHHAHLTPASHTGIKVMVKDDVLGIGAKRGSQDHECTGLDVFQDLLGRLSGKGEDEVEKGREARERMKKEIIIGEKYRMRFVLGEVYHSSDIEELRRKMVEEEEVKVKVKTEEEEGVTVKMEGLKVEVKEEREEEEENFRKKDKSRKRKMKEEDEEYEGGERRKRKKEQKEKEKKEKKDKEKKGRKERREKSLSKDSEVETSGGTTPSTQSDETLRSKSKKEKRDKEAKEASKDRKEKKDKRDKKDKKDKKEKKKREESKQSSLEISGIGAEDGDETTASVAAAARVLTGRRAIRHKYIAAKRSAVMDVQALNEIFMIKA